MVVSKGEEEIQKFLEEALPHVNYKRWYYVYYEGHKLFFDFYIPSYKLAIEIQGIQHYEFVEFFHEDRHGLRKQRLKDNIKREWALHNNINILEIDKHNFPKTPNELLNLIYLEMTR